ncbi:hypothetical protein [Ferriphaselus sp. R-1]|uniref:hypothetical protein n=1 Tax=Ferriphaselus sp. R-1 TaxID=1485544 RepID=UPI001268DE49|nr:hypothetical protein [Ferriphaselus sp. R-1]
MKTIFGFITLLFFNNSFAEYAFPCVEDGGTLVQMRADGQRDWSANVLVRNGDKIIQYRPDGQRDWSAPVYKIEGGIKVYVYRPDGQRDWSAPVYVLECATE